MSHDPNQARVAEALEPDLTDPDNPEWTEADFARAVRPEELSAVELLAFPRTLAKLRAQGKAPSEAEVTLRLDLGVLEHFRTGGPDWQARINAALKAAVAAEQRKA